LMPTMEHDLSTQENLDNLHHILETLSGELAPFFGGDSVQVSSWHRSLEAVAASLKNQTLRVAVVGPVKSGKSTFINALQGRDLLKRGAGIITAFITRIRSGPEERGWVEIKSWSEINAELNEALTMVGQPARHEELTSLDLRRKGDRSLLHQLLQEVLRDRPTGHDMFDPNSVLINAYLEGFKTVGGYVKDEPTRLEFNSEEVRRHQDFVGQESRAVYLRDMELQLPIPWLGESVEIGDCQGSDSPNPLHFAMLQEYLLGSHAILYLISSRVGVRQADLRLIEAIKILRLIPQTLFILNVDLDEHGGLEDLNCLRERAAEELRLLSPGVRIYTFSALLHLLESVNDHRGLSPRELRRLEGWMQEEALAEESRQGYEQFRAEFQHLLKRERNHILYGGVLGHLQRVSQSMKDSVSARQGLLSRNREELEELSGEIKRRQQSVAAVITTVENTLEGLQKSVKDKIGAAVDSYFDTQYGSIIRDTMTRIGDHPVDRFNRSRMREPKQLVGNLHLFYQDFRKALSRHIIEKVNLRIIDFAKNEEEEIEKRLLDAATAYWDLLDAALSQYGKTLTDLGLTVGLETPEILPKPGRPALTPPPFSAFLQHSDALGRGTLLLRFGVGRLRRFLAGVKDRVLRRDATSTGEAAERLFQEAVVLVKRETQDELLTFFKDYRQNFKYAYLFSFVDYYTKALVQVFRDFGEATMLDIGHLLEAAHKKGASQQDVSEDLAIIQQRLQYAEEQVRALKQGLGV
jgi:GTPase SAR1 family protein